MGYCKSAKVPDTPWHVGYPKMSEYDSRRHKARCYYYFCGWCCYGSCNCKGSTHCERYTESEPNLHNPYRDWEFHEENEQSYYENPKVEKFKFKGKQYSKIYVNSHESILVPYKKDFPKELAQKYIKEYKQQ